MKTETILNQLASATVVELDADALPELLADSKLLSESDTHLAGLIRILALRDLLLVQEQHPESRKLLLRGFTAREEAESFVRERLETYERMWDGCGCKVEYFK
ncbi:hypothetical protein DRQ53_08155 [bacterium]|nr:MAG: hypothetical protein DRQ53_08155 [bacterium]